MAQHDSDRKDIQPGTKRDEQLRTIREAARKESWITMLLRRRRETKGKPKRNSPVNKPWFRKKN